MFYLYKKSDYILEDKSQTNGGFKHYHLNFDNYTIRSLDINKDFDDLFYLWFPSSDDLYFNNYPTEGNIEFGELDFFDKKAISRTITIGNVIIESGKWKNENNHSKLFSPLKYA